MAVLAALAYLRPRHGVRLLDRLGGVEHALGAWLKDRMMTKGSLAKIALFLAGLFAGGVLDHGLLAWQGSETTSYGVHVGIGGNWLFMALDGTIAAALLFLHRRLEQSAARSAEVSATP